MLPADGGKSIRRKLRKKSLLITSDGSFKDGTSAFGYYIHAEKGGEMSGGGKCETHQASASSFDAEAFGALALTQALLAVVPQRKRCPTLSFTALIDNESMIKTINKCVNNNDIHPMSPCYKIFMQIKKNIESLGFKGVWKWVKGHQEDSQSIESILNSKVDKLANEHRKNESQILRVFPLEASVISIYHNNRPILSNLGSIIKEAATKEDSVTYLKRKFQWTEPNLNEIDWSIFAQSLKKRKLGNRITTIKNIFGWSNTGQQKERIQQLDPKCPVCKSQKEDSTHMFTCKNQPHHKAWETCKQILKKSIRSRQYSQLSADFF